MSTWGRNEQNYYHRRMCIFFSYFRIEKEEGLRHVHLIWCY